MTCFLILILLGAVSCTQNQGQVSPEANRVTDAVEQDQGQALTTEQKLFGLITVWSEAKYAFPSFDRLPDLDWDQSLQDYIPRVIAADDVESYYLVLAEFAALLNDGHTAVIPPWGYMNPDNDMPPVEVWVVKDKFVIVRVAETDEVKNQRIYPGLEIIEIDHVPAWTYYQENVLRYHTWGSKQANEAMNMAYLLDGSKDSVISLQVRDMDGTSRDVTLTRNSMDDQGNPFQYQFLQWDPVLESEILSDDILYIKIAHFMNPELKKEFLDVIDNLDRSVRGVVIDLRYCLGGQSDIAETMIGSLIDQQASSPTWKYPHYIAAHRSWGREPVWSETNNTIPPRDGKRYLGPLVILTGGVTGSTAEDFAISLHHSGRAVLVGGKTAGSAGNPLAVPLPGGGTFEVATFTASYPDGLEYVGIGIQPDVEMYPTREDVYDGIDSVLDQGIRVIEDWDAYRQ
ncbi:MAG: hypothetical protein GY832_17765 [Chloroflexi bacterium]|nr:hypothetical protein [Chloroflexota bacterium]